MAQSGSNETLKAVGGWLDNRYFAWPTGLGQVMPAQVALVSRTEIDTLLRGEMPKEENFPPQACGEA